jgi:hypothetical protein
MGARPLAEEQLDDARFGAGGFAASCGGTAMLRVGPQANERAVEPRRTAMLSVVC